MEVKEKRHVHKEPKRVPLPFFEKTLVFVFVRYTAPPLGRTSQRCTAAQADSNSERSGRRFFSFFPSFFSSLPLCDCGDETFFNGSPSFLELGWARGVGVWSRLNHGVFRFSMCVFFFSSLSFFLWLLEKELRGKYGQGPPSEGARSGGASGSGATRLVELCDARIFLDSAYVNGGAGSSAPRKPNLEDLEDEEERKQVWSLPPSPPPSQSI